MADQGTYPPTLQLALIAEGDATAFHRFYQYFAPLLRPFLYKNTRSEADSEDILQDTFIRIWTHRDQLPGITNLNAWVYRVAARAYLNHLRSRLREERKTRGFRSGDDNETPVDTVAARELKACVQKALQAIPEQRRKIYQLNREDGLKPAAIAKQLGMPVGTVKNNLSQALRELREAIIAEGHGPLIVICLLLKIF